MYLLLCMHIIAQEVPQPGFSPHFLMFGMHSRLLLDMAFGVHFAAMESVTTKRYVNKFKSHLYGHTKLLMMPISMKLRQKGEYNKDIICSKLEPEDLVLVW